MTTTAVASEDDAVLVEALLTGDEPAFMSLVECYQRPLLRLAQVYVRDLATAEETVQETWLGVLQGLDHFEGRSSLRTWIFRILVNRAKTRAKREARSMPFSTWSQEEIFEPSVDPRRFLPPDDPQWPGHWATPPKDWQATPEDLLVSAETRACIDEAIDLLPPRQRAVITLVDVEGYPTPEVSAILGVSGANLRVLLHRARSKVRTALERYFDPDLQAVS